ncbi:MAG: T9SS type A sorting domain-containing protein [Saprospiraceae bacterium]|nr:T9SS type A sorting domain-containing protein [Saprospiraceae bacterium]
MKSFIFFVIFGFSIIANLIYPETQDNSYITSFKSNAKVLGPFNQGEEEFLSGSWSALGTGLNSTALTVAVDNNNHVWTGGFFSFKLWKWDGTSWSIPGGSGMNGDCDVVRADLNNNLVYAGGKFTSASGTSASRIARWNGTSWSALGSGLNFDCYAIAIDNSGNVYAGGAFLQAGGNSVNYVAKWDGSSWSALGSGLNDICRALAVDDMGNVYAGGQFTQAGGTAVNYVAKWDGSSWSAVGSGFNFWCFSLEVDSHGDLYAGGGFTTAGGTSANRIAKWDGTSWSALGSGLDGQCQSIKCHSDGNIYAGGTFTTAGGSSANRIASWDGVQWSALGGGLSSTCFGIDIAGDGNLYAAGIFTSAGGNSANRIASWNGTILPVQWSSFDGNFENGDIILHWQTASETNNVGFDIQHAGDNNEWKDIGFVNAAKNPNQLNNYSFIHPQPSFSKNYYRLKQMDMNGDYQFSHTIKVLADVNNDLRIFPNPVRERLFIKGIPNKIRSIEIYNVNGQLLMNQTLLTDNSIDLSNLNSGQYLIKIHSSNKESHTFSFIKI